MLQFQIAIVSPSAGAPLAVSFDAAATALGLLPRMFIEPDGSFVWTGETADRARWQVDGNLIDRGDVLAYVEVNGSCPEERFDALLRCLSWPEVPLAFELTRRGVTLNEAEFRDLARTLDGAT